METDVKKKVMVIVLGDSMTGKTALIRRFIENEYDDEYLAPPLTSNDPPISKKTMQISGVSADVSIHDNSTGYLKQLAHRGINPPYKKVDAVIICFEAGEDDESSAYRESFKNAYNWAQEMERYGQREMSLVLVALKMDQRMELPTPKPKKIDKEISLTMSKEKLKEWREISKRRIKNLIESPQIAPQSLSGIKIMELPDFVVLKIMRYFSPLVISRCAAVNFKWFRLMENDDRWQESYSNRWRMGVKKHDLSQSWRRRHAEMIPAPGYKATPEEGLADSMKDLSLKINCNYAYASAKTGEGVEELFDYIVGVKLDPKKQTGTGYNITSLPVSPVACQPVKSTKSPKIQLSYRYMSSPPWWQCEAFFRPKSGGLFKKAKDWVLGRYAVTLLGSVYRSLVEVPRYKDCYDYTALKRDSKLSVCQQEISPPLLLCGPQKTVPILFKAKEFEIIFHVYQKDVDNLMFDKL